MSSALTQAKLVVLGDQGTGKSSLVRHLCSGGSSTGINSDGKTNIQETADTSLTCDIVFSPKDLGLLDNSNEVSWEGNTRSEDRSVVIKSIEYPSHSFGETAASQHELELSMRCALFCIITVDLRDMKSMTSAFGKWHQIKQQYMDSSFLIVVGTHIDCTLQRRIDVVEISKLCAQKDALYIEVSNVDRCNISLLKRLMSQRIKFMIQARESLADDIARNIKEFNETSSGIGLNNSSEEAKMDIGLLSRNKLFSNIGGESTIHPLLEPEILSSSIGDILSSSLGIPTWPGLDLMSEDNPYVSSNYELAASISNLKEIASGVNKYIDILNQENEAMAVKCLVHPPDFSVDMLAYDNKFADDERANDIDEILRIFDMIGYTASLPNPPAKASSPDHISDQVSVLSSTRTNTNTTRKSRKSKERKNSTISSSTIEKSKTPPTNSNTSESKTYSTSGGTPQYATVTSSDSGLKSNIGPATIIPTMISSKSPDDNVDDLLFNTQSTAPEDFKFISKKKCKVRIQLPSDDLILTNSQTVDVRVNIGDDLGMTVQRLVESYRLTYETKLRILNQLHTACCS